MKSQINKLCEFLDRIDIQLAQLVGGKPPKGGYPYIPMSYYQFFSNIKYAKTICKNKQPHFLDVGCGTIGTVIICCGIATSDIPPNLKVFPPSDDSYRYTIFLRKEK